MTARGAVGDRRGDWATILGTAAGIATHAVLAGAGLAAVVMQSAELYRILRLLGAVYLVALGVSLLWRARATPTDHREDGSAEAPSPGAAHGRRAFVANVLNVKAAAVYLTLAPQFVPEAMVGAGAMLQLALVHIGVMVAWPGLWSTGLLALGARWDIAAWRRWIDRAGGAVLVLLGVRTAAAER